MSQEFEDQGGLDEATDRQPRTVSKAAFGCLSWTLCLVIMIAEIAVALTVSRGLGVRIEGGWIGGMAFPNLILAKVAADGILKLMGLSCSGKTIEARGRMVAFPEGEIDDDEVIEVRCPSSLILGLSVAFLICCLLIILLLAAIPHRQMEGIGWAYALLGFFGLGAVYFLYEGPVGEAAA
jgi:hypothetical protein